jgi:hypothetical protein
MAGAGAQKKQRLVNDHNLDRKETTVKRGHVTGHKKERKGASDWHKKIYEENLARIEKEWQEKQKQGK